MYAGRALGTGNASAVSSTQINSSFQGTVPPNSLSRTHFPLTNSKFSISLVKSCILNLSYNGVRQPHAEFCSITYLYPAM